MTTFTPTYEDMGFAEDLLFAFSFRNRLNIKILFIHLLHF